MEKLEKYKELFMSELNDYCIPFWLNNSQDTVNGGIKNCLDRNGKLYSEDKSVWMQGRCGYTFSLIYNTIEKKQEYLDFAKSCIDFATNNCIDSDKRMYFTVTEKGAPLRKRRYWFSESFYAIANAEYYTATGDEQYLAKAIEYFNFIYDIYCDGANDPYKITPKSYAETRNTKALACPMILLNVTSIIKAVDKNNDRYDDIITKLIADIKNFYSPEHGLLFESITSDNKFLYDNSASRIINPGHTIECCWFLLEQAIERDDKELMDFVAKLFDDTFEFGWDKEYGGISYLKDVLGLPVEAYEHDMKLWWPQNETVICSLMLYKATGDDKYRQIFEQITEYAFKNFSDRENGGEWLGYLHRDNTPTLPVCKGHTYKGPFHAMRMMVKVIEMLG